MLQPISYRPIYGLIFLFKWVKEQDDRAIDYEAADSKGVFFASQVINNACATQALISILLNCPHIIPDLGPELSQLKEFTTGFPSEMKGLAIGNSETIRCVHNSFTPPQPFVPEEKPEKGSENGDAYHFVAYVPAGNDGGVYELDGLKPGPIRIGECSPSTITTTTTKESSSSQVQIADDAWLDVASKVIEERIAKYAAAEVRFNLMAVVKSRLDLYSEQLKAAELRCRRIEAKLSSSAAAGAVEQGKDQGTTNNNNNKIVAAAIEEEELPTDRDTLESVLLQTKDEIDRLKLALQGEKEKRAQWEDENLRRRTDYTPVIFQSLKALAGAGLLQGLIDKAKKKQLQLEEEEAKKKKKETEKHG